MRRPAPEVVVPYEVSCSCGRPLRGWRQRSRQIVSCTSCGRKRFILPSSAWLVPTADAQPKYLSLRNLLIVIVLGGALAMGLCLLLLRPYLRQSTTTATLSGTDVRAQLEAGERQLRDGNVFLALNELNAAVEQAAWYPQSLFAEQHDHLQQLRRQTDLLARLLDQPLEDIVRQAMQHRSDQEWAEKFAQYRGRTVVFDDVLRRDGKGRPVLGFYTIRVAGVEAWIALEDLTLLRRLPLEPPRRILFGARLASCRREEGGIWVLRFEPDSAVLFTDESAAAVCCPLPLDEELLKVLKRQDEWLRH
jgi:hypothetical protein